MLLRDRYHALGEGELVALARFAAGAGGVRMTSDTLDRPSPQRAARDGPGVLAPPRSMRRTDLG